MYIQRALKVSSAKPVPMAALTNNSVFCSMYFPY